LLVDLWQTAARAQARARCTDAGGWEQANSRRNFRALALEVVRGNPMGRTRSEV